MEVIDFGLKEYQDILDLQEKIFTNLIKSKREKQPEQEYILLGEHPPVLTLGRRAKDSNIIVPKKILDNQGINIYHIGRGGDVTYHCPGQLIVYPIIDLEKHKLGVKDYVYLLEEAVIKLLQKYDIKGERVNGATGIWIGKDRRNERKICAIGIKCNHFCTMHGLALNVNSDLSGFSYINPCGFTDKGVTSMEKEMRAAEQIDDFFLGKVKRQFLDIFFSLIFPL